MPFQPLSAPLTEPEPYLQTQAAIVQFFQGGFQGKVPAAVVPKAPVRDAEGSAALRGMTPGLRACGRMTGAS